MRCEEWSIQNLGDIITFKNGKKRPECKGTIPVYGGNGIMDYCDTNNNRDVVIIGRVGAYCGSVYYAKNVCWVSDNAISGSNTINSDIVFAYYLLKNLKLNSRRIGTSQPLLTQEILNNIVIKLPPLPEQKRIASILSALDDKIELNNRMNKNLEAQAQAIFKSWFVDFEPWGGVMPEDWIVGTLRDICSYSDKRIKKTAFDIFNYVSTENMLAEKQGIVNASSLPNVDSATCFEVGNTLISNIRPYFKKIYYCDFKGACSTDVLCFVPKSENLQEYVFFTLFSDSFFEYVMSGSKGTKMPRGDKSQIMQYKICFSEVQLILFSKAAKPLLDVISLNRKQSQTLAALRDTLLPKLMSGEIEVKEEE